MSKIDPKSWLVSGGRPDAPGDPLNAPLVPASNFLHGGGRVYMRDGGAPGWESLETLVGGLEGGEAVSYSSGMAAVAAVFDQLDQGARVVMPGDCYYHVAEMARAGERKGMWSVRFLPLEDTQSWIEAAGQADLLWLESPSNPLLIVADLRAIGAAPRKAGSLLVVDNTFATPLNQRPLEHGADIALHSATKFIGGHSDLLCGVAVAGNPELADSLRRSRTVNGATPGALETFLAVRGARTLALRMEAAQENAGRLARWLDGHPAVETVRYPGLESHPTHPVAAALMDGFGTMISFDPVGGAAAGDALCAGVRLVRHATSLGGVESTMERRAALPGQEHLPAGLVRLSVGIESCKDLEADLDQALRMVS